MMNEILKKRIEDFASGYAESMYKNSTDGERKAAKHDVINGAEFILCRQWISVEEALPEYDEAVIVAFGDDDYALLHRSNNSNVLTDKNGFCNYSHKEVIAWMPIPKFETKK